jgi:sensor histidine kinase regulating citrate/malate metabolism
MKLGIATKINIYAAVIIIITLVFLCWFFIHHETQAITKELNERAAAVTRNLASNCEYGMLVRDNDELNRMLKGVTKEKDIAYAQIEDKKGKIVAQLEKKKKENDW